MRGCISWVPTGLLKFDRAFIGRYTSLELRCFVFLSWFSFNKNGDFFMKTLVMVRPLDRSVKLKVNFLISQYL